MHNDDMRCESYILLHDIRSVYNVGAIFRTADAIGVSKIYLTGYTPTPLDRFNNPRKDFAKSALGSEFTVPWEYAKSPLKILTAFKKGGGKIICIEQTKDSIDYKKVKPGPRTLVILGNEVEGIPSSILKKADVIADIPMKGKKESLNISVAAGIALYRLFDQ